MESACGAMNSPESNIEELSQGERNRKSQIAVKRAIERQRHFNYENKLGFPRKNNNNGRNLDARDDNVFIHRLKVKEAHIQDVGRYIVRIDRSSLILMDLQVEDIVIVKGKNGQKIAAKCLDSMLLEIEPIIRMDRVMRYSLGLHIDDTIESKSVTKADKDIIYNNSDSNNNYQGEIVLESLALNIPASVDERYVARALEGISVVIGQIILIPCYGGLWFPYAVIRISKSKRIEVEQKMEKSDNLAVTVGPDTSIRFDSK
jgi:hypothetical protein